MGSRHAGVPLYDLAGFAVLTRDTLTALSPFLDGYQHIAPEAHEELGHLDTFVRLRWMCHAIYFASRLGRGITRGAASEAETRERLAEAYAGLTQVDPMFRLTRSRRRDVDRG